MKQWLLLFLKGMAMGAADVVPGVSGGTIAFISGIYEELLDSIRSINLQALKVLKSQGLAKFWQAINGNFLLVLFSGIIFSIASLAKLVSYLLAEQPILIWSFFFGLIVASIIYIFRQLPHLRWQEWVGLWSGTIVALAVSFAPRMQGSEDLFILFCAGAVAICAMILPGVSGSFILLLLGVYPIIIGAISELALADFVSFCIRVWLWPIGLFAGFILAFASLSLNYYCRINRLFTWLIIDCLALEGVH